VKPKGKYVVTDVDTGAMRNVTGTELGALSVSVANAPGSALLIYARATPLPSRRYDPLLE
jgi:hypothetical protein